ncbi:hypothetical protein NC652_027736 [Populus alba x Populus x berolinensis]|nr:hypothetical protein NC652_027736 [Populus alba x Populus x berolinensis]
MILELVTALKHIVETLLGGQPFEVGDACNQPGTLYNMNLLKNETKKVDSEANSTVMCNCTLNNDGYCHITSLYLKWLSLPGKLPPEMTKLAYLEILDLSRNYISGNIPEEWASMKHLTKLFLTSNRLSGNIPGYLGRFRSLTDLSLEANQFSGTIPSQLGDLVNLTFLVLSSNQLEGTLPKTLAKLNLTHFELYASGLQGPIPPAILSLEYLTDLRITDMSGPESNLATIPPRVNYLDLTFNKMEGRIPREAKTREFMFLSGNKLNGSVPDSFFKTDKKIDVSYNNFSLPPSCQDHQSGLLPCSRIHECPKSYRSFHVNCGGPDVTSGSILYEGDEIIKGQRTYCPEPGEASKIPIVVGVVTSALLLVLLVMGVICWKFYFRDKVMRERVEALRQIGKTVNEDGQLSLKFVDSCQPNGLVKTELTSAPPNLEGNSTIECNCSITDDNYCRITSFLLKDYSLPGRLPPELANLTYVQKIDFTRNYLYGTIPVEWASMKNLSFISLTANRLSGNIPGHLGSFTALTYLSLESNQFSGVVPPELGKLVNLKTLILSGNKLVGTLPEALAQIKDLKDFRVSDNNLNGTVPEFIGNWTQLQKLDLYATGLQGPIPLAIFHLEKLSDLRIADMPGPEFQLPNSPIERQFLVLRNINLTGTIPENAWKVEKTLDLTFNKLVGEIPPNTIRRRQFTFLSGNKLTGTVQDSFLQNSPNLSMTNTCKFMNCMTLTEYTNMRFDRSALKHTMFRTITFHGHQDAAAVTSKDAHKYLKWDILGGFETE